MPIKLANNASGTLDGFTAIYINGVYQNRNTYTVTSGTVTFSQAPPYYIHY
jgi:hypothetical protein